MWHVVVHDNQVLQRQAEWLMQQERIKEEQAGQQKHCEP